MRCFFLFFWPIRLSIIVIFFVVCFESVNFVSFFLYVPVSGSAVLRVRIIYM